MTSFLSVSGRPTCVRSAAQSVLQLTAELLFSLCLCDRGQTCWKLEAQQRKGLMTGKVASATHKYFTDVNKCVHAQRGAAEVFSGLPYRKFGDLSPLFSRYVSTQRAHAETKCDLDFKEFNTTRGHKPW